MLMKKSSAICLLLAACTGVSFAQNRSGVGIHASGFDYAGPITGQYLFHEKTDIINGSGPKTTHRLLWRPGVRIGYFKELNRFFDLNLGLSATNIEIPLNETDNTYENRVMYNTSARQLYLGGDVRVNFNILDKTKYIVTPYLFAGVTPTYKDDGYGYGYITATVPLGLGFNFNVGRNIDLQLESGYRLAITNREYNHLQHSAGIVFWFVRPKEAAPVVEVLPPADTDHDGVPDGEDQCPTIAGPAALNGCPDSDNDGIADNRDECPMIAGKPEFNGCPDSDNDGIPDNRDKCPYVAGTADREGCPPEEIKQEIIHQVDKAAKAIFFETGKSVLRKDSYTQLDIVVGILKDNPGLFADIEGHTDNVGSDELNMKLSDRRAAVVRDYFVSKGISADRLTSVGYGESRPIATNDNAAGRAQNRRTVISLRNYAK